MTQDSIKNNNRLSSITFAVHTDTGRKREENQDSYGIVEGQNIKVFMVADGMGGARGGAVASSLAMDLLKSSLRGKEELSCGDLSSLILDANKGIADRAYVDTTLSGMGTTIVGIGFDNQKTFIFNVGDSRLYRLSKNGVRTCTEDHTLVHELLKSGAIGPEQAKNHPVSHMLTRSLGPSAELKVDCYELSDGPYSQERFLLCSDGLYNQVTSQEIEQHLRKYPIDQAVKLLVDLANERGGPDNITTLIIELGDEFPVDTRTIEAPSPEFVRVPDSSITSSVSESSVSQSRADKLGLDSQRLEKRSIAQGFESQQQDDSSFLGEDSRPSNPDSEVFGVDEVTGSLNDVKTPTASRKVFSTVSMLVVVSILTTLAVVLLGVIEFSDSKQSSQFHPDSIDVNIPVDNETLEEVKAATEKVEVIATVEIFPTAIISPEAVLSATETLPPVVTELPIAPTIPMATIEPTSTEIPVLPLPTVFSPPTLPPVSTPAEISEKVIHSRGEEIASSALPDVQGAIISGEQAILVREREVAAKIGSVSAQIKFLSNSAEQRAADLKLVNDEKFELNDKVAYLTSAQKKANVDLEVLKLLSEKIKSKDPLVLVAELAGRFSKVDQLHKEFEKATAAYLQAVQERTAFADSSESAQRLAESLDKRSEALSALISGTKLEIETEISRLEGEIQQNEVEMASLSEKLDQNEKQYSNYNEIASIVEKPLISDKKRVLEQQLKLLQAELSSLGTQAH